MTGIVTPTSVRADPFSFFALAAVSFLESTVATYVENLAPYFEGDPEILRWLQTVWLPEEAEHGRLARQYVEKTWPEFDWKHGYKLFLCHYRPRCDYKLLRPSPALEALARCVTETEATMMYRCLGSYAVDRDVKSLMKKLGSDEVRHYTYFRDVFDRYDKMEKNSFWLKARTIIGRSALVRDEDLALAFMPLNSCWRGRMPFEKMTYNGFLIRTSMIIEQHFPFEAAKRMLFRPLGKGSRLEALAVDFITWMVKRQYPKKTSPMLSLNARTSIGRVEFNRE
jgi:hypothetical protein